MRKRFKLTLALLGLALFVISNMSSPTYVNAAPQRMVTGIDIMIFKGNNSIHSDLDGFVANYTDAGNNVTVVSDEDVDFTTEDLSGVEALIMNTKMNMTAANITAIKDWFTTSTDRMLWITGDDDYKSYHNVQFSPDNKLLKELGSWLRVDGGGINDAVSNDDGETYRVMANSSGVSSALTDYVTTGFTVMKFHGPAAIMYTPDGDATYKDLRNATLGSLGPGLTDIVINSSSHAYPLDQDTSLASYDFYFSSSVQGDYPMLVTQRDLGGAGNLLVVSGEAPYSSYKFMYGNVYENEPKSHQGSMVVDNLFAYQFTVLQALPFVNLVRDTDYVTLPAETVTQQVNFTESASTVTEPAVTVTSTKEGDSPISTAFVGLAFVTLAVFTTLKRKKLN